MADVRLKSVVLHEAGECPDLARVTFECSADDGRPFGLSIDVTFAGSIDKSVDLARKSIPDFARELCGRSAPPNDNLDLYNPNDDDDARARFSASDFETEDEHEYPKERILPEDDVYILRGTRLIRPPR